MTWGFLEVAGVPTSVAAWETFWDRLVTWLIGDGLRVLLTIVLALVVRWLAHRAIDRVVAVMTSRSRSWSLTWTW